MKREDMLALADLARIELSDAEAERFGADFDGILDYVGAIKGLAAEGGEPVVGPVHNVFRNDTDPTPPDTYTETLLAAAPKRHGRFLKVKKVLSDNG